MDRGWRCVESLVAGTMGQFDCPLEVSLYNPDPQSEACQQLQGHDIVNTTYQTLASDYMPRGKNGSKQPERKLRASGIFNMEWRGARPNEGHIARSPFLRGASAVYDLMARSSWVLADTPIVN